MNGKFSEDLFKTAIKKLETDDDWDRVMIGSILKERRRGQIIKFAYSGTAAAVFFLTVFFLWTSMNSYISSSIENMISVQIDGTYSTVFNSGPKGTSAHGPTDRDLLDSDIDNVIENSLEMR